MKEQQELTVLFYFASDNPLAPVVVSEIKAIKDAGFQENTNVLVYFDPMEKGVATKLYDVNCQRKEKQKTKIGDGPDPFVRNMCEDEVDDKELTPEMQAAMKGSDSVTAFVSLDNFIQFALSKRRAKNYMLFLIGHGMIVGNDAFLPDVDPISAITLVQLKQLCAKFTTRGKTSLQLLSLHSCSMSSIEVAYQLRGLAGYMLATQGTSFVNGWPYRQLLKKILNEIRTAKNKERKAAGTKANPAAIRPTVDYPNLIKKLYFLCLFNFTDFMSAGYSCDLALCRLDPEKLAALNEPLAALVAAMKDGLFPRVSVIKDLILLAHWEAQSFWSETYTDLWDFCFCLARRCEDRAREDETIAEQDKTTADKLIQISKACKGIIDVLAPAYGSSEGLIRFSDNFGSQFQYAHGLSIYFPWCEPLDDQRAVFESEDETESLKRQSNSKKVLDNYENYDFTREFRDNSWFSFLRVYFDQTQRAPRDDRDEFLVHVSDKFGLTPDVAEFAFRKAQAEFNNGVLKRTHELIPKRTPEEGIECTCPSIKNYPTFPYAADSDRHIRKFSITPGALRTFLPCVMKRQHPNRRIRLIPHNDN